MHLLTFIDLATKVYTIPCCLSHSPRGLAISIQQSKMVIDSRCSFDMKCLTFARQTQHGGCKAAKVLWCWCRLPPKCHSHDGAIYQEDKIIKNLYHYTPLWNGANAAVLVLSLIGLQWQGGGFTKWLGRGSNTETGEAADFDWRNCRDPGQIPNRKGTGRRVLDGFRGGALRSFSCLFHCLRRKDVQPFCWIYVWDLHIFLKIHEISERGRRLTD